MKRKKGFPVISIGILSVIALLALGANVIAPYPPGQLNGNETSLAPSLTHLFGTDTMGRDLFSMLLYGGRASLFIGTVAAAISTVIAVVYGCISGLAGEKVDDLLMRIAELIMSIPSILMILFLQAILGTPTYLSISVVIGVTGWMNMAKIVRSEVRQIGKSDYILAAKSMDADFSYMLRVHLLPNFISSLMFMVVTAIGQAIITESTLSFLGLGLPLTTVSWGSLMSLSETALLSNCWWMIVIPGAVLILTLVCITQVGEYIRRNNNRLHSNL